MTVVKCCSMCKAKLPLDYFHSDKTKALGRSGRCKLCSYAEAKRRHALTPEKRAAASKKWRAANVARNASQQKEYRDANPEKRAANYKKWADANPAKVAARNKAPRRENLDKAAARKKAWRIANPEKVRIYNENRRAREHSARGKLSTGLAAKLFKLQRGMCPCCKKPLGKGYHLDHIVPLVRGGSNTDDNIQLLRSRCNVQKHAKDPVAFMQSRGFLL